MLKQIEQVQDYVYKFRNLVGQIEEMGQLDQVMHFVEGLKSATRVEVNYRAPDTLTDAIEVAIAYDTARFGPGHALSSSNHHQQSYSHSNYRQQTRYNNNSGPQPMELDNINRRNNNGNQRQNRMTDEEKTRLQHENRCFKCKEVGH